MLASEIPVFWRCYSSSLWCCELAPACSTLRRLVTRQFFITLANWHNSHYWSRKSTLASSKSPLV